MSEIIIMNGTQKIEVLMLLLQENNKHLVFWRERNWIAFRDTVAGLLAIAGLIKISPHYGMEMIAVNISIAIISTMYLIKNYNNYQDKLERGAKIEEALLLFKCGEYLTEESVHPDKYKTPTANILGTYIFIAAIWIITIAISVVLLKK